jgi:hypothetical protein
MNKLISITLIIFLTGCGDNACCLDDALETTTPALQTNAEKITPTWNTETAEKEECYVIVFKDNCESFLDATKRTAEQCIEDYTVNEEGLVCCDQI